MVYCGKPSKGCQLCRDRKTRCDKAIPSCSQCLRGKRVCPGYRNELDLMFRIENETVIEKSKSREATKSGSMSAIQRKEREGTGKHESRSLTSYSTSEQGEFVMAYMPPTALRERAQNWFFANNCPEWIPSFNVIETFGRDELVLASITAVGLASYSNTVGSLDMMLEARKSYGKALQLTNLALRTPEDVTKDSTLLSVLVLGKFEMVSGNSEASLRAWTRHIEGASALVKIRGPEQFSTIPARGMFYQVLSDMIASCLQRSIAVPEHLRDLRAIVGPIGVFYSPGDSALWDLVSSIIQFSSFRASINSPECILSHEEIVQRALELDADFSKFSANSGERWGYKILEKHDNPNVIWDKLYHVYDDPLALEIWNALRTCRMLIQRIICDQFKVAHRFSPAYTQPRLDLSTSVLRQMQADILASVPHQFSDSRAINQAKTCSPNSFIFWSLYLACIWGEYNPNIRQWAIKRLRVIFEETGIQQASLLASFFESNVLLDPWNISLEVEDISKEEDESNII